jgi:putative peptidoglycan lipid II flippase
MIRAIATVGGLTLVSRIAGLARDLLMAAVLGAGALADAFMVAFRLPNHFRAIFGEGAFNAAFTPTYAQVLTKEGEAAARLFSGQILSILLLSQITLLLLAWVCMPQLVHSLAPGFRQDSAQFMRTIELTRITFPYLACMTLVTLICALLNTHKRFAAAAFVPTLLNVAMIGALLVVLFVQRSGNALPAWVPDASYALAWAVLLAGFLELVFVWLALERSGVKLRFALPRFGAQVILFFKRFGPAVLGAAGTQIALFADTIIATLLPTGSVSYLYYADRLYQLPLAIIGIAIGTALLPELSRLLAQGDDKSAAQRQWRALEIGMVLTLPCAIVFILMGETLLTALFARGAFDVAAAQGSAQALQAYAFGLPAFVLIRCLVPAFHARGDTATPVKIFVLALGVNLVLKLLLTGPLLHAGLALATSVGAWINALLMLVLLCRSKAVVLPENLRRPLSIWLALLCLASGFIYACTALLPPYLANLPTAFQPWALLGIALVPAGLLYLPWAWQRLR